MNKNFFGKVFKILTITMGICGAFIYIYAIPLIGKTIIKYYPEFQNRYYPWFIFLLLTGIPCYIVLFNMWKISDYIEKEKPFTNSNAHRFNSMANATYFDSIFLLAGNILLILNKNHPSILIISFMICLMGGCIGTAFKCLSDLTYKAAILQSENDLTI